MKENSAPVAERPSNTGMVTPAAGTGGGQGWSVVLATSLVQAMMAFAAMTLATIAPEVARSLDVPPALIGYQIGLVFGAGVVTALFAGTVIRRVGGCRISQFCLLLGGVGCAITAVPNVAAIAGGSILMGLAYGVTNPSASHLLNRFADRRHRGLVFSIKQAGVPVGGVLAGFVAPPLALALGWQWVPIAVATTLFALAAVLQRPRSRWDDDRDPTAVLRESPLRGLRLVFMHRPVRWLSIGGGLYAMVLLSLTGYLVTLLVEEVGFSLVEAGIVLASVQVGATVARLAWGWLADRTRDGLGVLLVIGLIMLVATLATSQLSPAWPPLVVRIVLIVFGIGAIGWVGVFYAELARLSPEGEVGTITGGALALTYGGTLAGPSLFALTHGLVGSYTTSFALLAIVAAAGTTCMALSRKTSRVDRG